MSLNLEKLTRLLMESNMVITKLFCQSNRCVYLEMLSVATAENFLIYIPSKYDIEPNDKIAKFKIKEMDIESAKYDDQQGEDNELINLKVDDDVEEQLENNYKHSTNLKQIIKTDIDTLRGVYKQIKRIGFSVKNIPYKLAIIFNNYICVIRRDDSISIFFIKNYNSDKEKQLYVVVDLETFYAKSFRLLDDLQTVKSSVYKVLEKNQNIHVEVFNGMMNNKKIIESLPIIVQQKNREYDTMITELQTLLAEIARREKQLNIQLHAIKNKQGNLNIDVSRVHQMSTLERELDQLLDTKGKATANILALKIKKENCILNVDKLLFENSVMWDNMMKNFKTLKDFC